MRLFPVIVLLLLVACTEQVSTDPNDRYDEPGIPTEPSGPEKESVLCSAEQRAAIDCTNLYLPVCGRYLDGYEQTFPNSCDACRQPEVDSYVEGECGKGTAPVLLPGETACPESYRGQEICTLEYNPVCGSKADGSSETYGNLCGACTSADVLSYTTGECPVELSETTLTMCDPEKRPDACTKEYRPVCGQVDTGIRCITAPCPSTTAETFGNACTACADEKVTAYAEGACEEQRLALCDQGEKFIDAHQWAEDIGATCVGQCPEGWDTFQTQIGIPHCTPHYGKEEALTWPTCEQSSGTCDCVYATESTDGRQIGWDDEEDSLRCVPPIYAERLLFTGGRHGVDENGDEYHVIA